ncbi:MAG: BON domain-containing protein [Planctomycetia bacterium]|nr:BON domain-containing protein [Planctomycetia bacterium]
MDEQHAASEFETGLDLERRVRQFFLAARLPALRHVRIKVRHDRVLLTGCVQTFHEKQMATEFARRVAGVVNVVNSIEVPITGPVASL